MNLASTQFSVSDDHIGSPLGTAFNCRASVALAPNATVSKATKSGAGLTSHQPSATATAAG